MQVVPFDLVNPKACGMRTIVECNPLLTRIMALTLNLISEKLTIM